MSYIRPLGSLPQPLSGLNQTETNPHLIVRVCDLYTYTQHLVLADRSSILRKDDRIQRGSYNQKIRESIQYGSNPS